MSLTQVHQPPAVAKELVAKFAPGVVDTGGKFTANVTDPGGKFATDVIDSSGAPWLANISANFSKQIGNDPSVIFRGLKEDDSWKKFEAKISWHCPLKEQPA
jgi:hypothetical protein